MNIERIFKEIKETYLALKLTEVKHRLTVKKNYAHMAQAMVRFKQCKNKKPKPQIRREMKLSQKYWGCYPLFYYRYDLYKKEKELSERELLNYIPQFFFYDVFLPFHNPRKYAILVEDKIITEQLFRSLSISQPRTICKLINNQIYTDELKEKSFHVIEHELAERQYQKIFVKPVDGQGGYGIYIFNKDDSGHYVTSDHEVFNEDFLHKIGSGNDFMIESGVEQDSELSKVYPYSVNTFRIATENKNGKVRILCATLRMGRNGMQVDNGTQGGIMVKIDIKTGATGDHANSETCEYFLTHPDTGFVFKNHQIMKWDDIRKFTIGAAKKFPQFTYLGWDIALAQNGPIVIETNFGFGLDHYQVALGGLREIFEIDDPQFYWRNKGNRGIF